MEIIKLTLDDTEEDDFTVALIMLSKSVPDYELFFHINTMNSFCFERMEDLVLDGNYYTHYFPVFKGYNKESKACFRFLANKSTQSVQNKEVTELFMDEGEVKYLMDNYKETDYILASSDKCADFSLILLPENLCFQPQEIFLGSDEELFHIIQYYE